MPTREQAWPEGTPCWVDLAVDNAAAASEFYTALFGWDVDANPPAESGGYRIASLKGKHAAAIMPKPPGMQMPSVWTTYIAVDDADAIAGKVAAAGGNIAMPVMDVMDVGRMFIGIDSTGGAFGAWQSKLHTGAQIYNEPGAYAWNELHTRDYRGAREFYASVFGWSYAEVGDGTKFVYAMFVNPGATDPVGGISDDSKLPGETPTYWLTWFSTASVDDTLERLTLLGGKVLMPASDSPFGRMAVVSGLEGEVFGIVDTATTTGSV